MLSYVVISTPERAGVSAEELTAVATRCESALPFAPTRRFSWRDATTRIGVLAWERSVVIDTGGRASTSPLGITLFDGTPMPKGGWASGTSWSEQLDGRLRSGDRAHRLHALDRLGGVYSVVHVGADGWGLVASDPLGVMPVYHLRRTDGATVMASNPRLVERAATSGDERLGRDAEAVGWILAIGYGFGRGSGFSGVERFAPDRYGELTGDGRVVERSRRWLVPATRHLRADEVVGTTGEIGAEIVDNLRAMAALPAPLVVGLTGGRDTRVLVAAARAAGVAERFRYQTMGAVDSADVVLAQRLAAHLGVDHRIVGGQRPARPPGWLLDRLRQTAYVCCGTVPGKELRLPSEPATHAFVTGELGEGYRTTEASQRAMVDEADLDAYLRARLLHHHRGGLVRPEIERHYLERFRARVMEHRGATVDLGDALHHVFLEKMIMNRWGSHELLNGPQPRLYPLYSVDAFRVALALGHDGRRHELLPFALVRHLDDTVARLPLADRPFPAEALALAAVPSEYPAEAVVGAKGFATLKGSSLADHRAAFAATLLDDRTNPVFELLDRERVEQVVLGQAAVAPRYERDLYNAAGAAVWLGCQDERPTTSPAEVGQAT